MSAHKLQKKMEKDLKREIEIKRSILNEMITKGRSKDDILKLSKELDELIGKYHKWELNKNKQHLW